MRSLALIAVAIIVSTSSAHGNPEPRDYAPIVVTDSKGGGPLIDPGDFAEGSKFLHTTNRTWLGGNTKLWSTEDVLLWLADPANRELSKMYEMKPNPERSRHGVHRNKELSNLQAMRAGQGVFSHASDLGNGRVSMKYFLFFGWNETAYVGGEGNHEGDWICIDLQVDRDTGTIEYAILHNHGRQLLVEASALELKGNQPIIYLEGGTNEPWPNAGERGFGGYPRAGLQANRFWPEGEGQDSEHKVVRQHRGKGYRFDTRDAIIDLRDNEAVRQSPSAQLVTLYRGQWGEKDDDDLKGIHGQDVTNPKSPVFQGKMWDRSFVEAKYRRDPRSAPEVWRNPPRNRTAVNLPAGQRPTGVASSNRVRPARSEGYVRIYLDSPYSLKGNISQELRIGEEVRDLEAFSKPSGGHWNDQISAIVVAGGARIVLYEDAKYAGRRIIIGRGVANLHDSKYGFGDDASSLKVLKKR